MDAPMPVEDRGGLICLCLQRAFVAQAFDRSLAKTTELTSAASSPPAGPLLTCGLVMPISATDGCSADHWLEVKQIIQDAVGSIESPRFDTKLVSDGDEAGVIHRRIVQGVYQSDIVVCDVSGKNPNVMFELGMRLAFDKPTVLIKDDKTDYSFDTGVIEHIPYPRDLRFSRILSFKRQLADKVLATHTTATSQANYSSFLKNFGTYNVAHLAETNVSAEKLILEAVNELQREVERLRRDTGRYRSFRSGAYEGSVKSLLSALHRFRDEDPAIEFRFTPELERRLMQEPGTTAGFDSSREFREAIDLACALAQAGSVAQPRAAA
jgi:hypothetical protein